MSVIRLIRIILTGAMLSLAALASGCSSIDRLSQIGEKPKLTEIENPTTQPGYKPVQMPMPKPEQASYNANSLWRNGSRALWTRSLMDLTNRWSEPLTGVQIYFR